MKEYKHYSTKTYHPEEGISAAFRQWRADSHCRFIHGYALGFRFVFGADELDVRNWVVDFGSLKSLKETIKANFDHKTLIAEDDPETGWFREAEHRGILDLVIVEKAGCEAFAELLYEYADVWLKDYGYKPRVDIVEVEVFEHGANSAIYRG